MRIPPATYADAKRWGSPALNNDWEWTSNIHSRVLRRKYYEFTNHV